LEFTPGNFYVNERGEGSTWSTLVIDEANPRLTLLQITFTNSWLNDTTKMGLTALTRTPSEGMVFPTALNGICVHFNENTKVTSIFGAFVRP